MKKTGHYDGGEKYLQQSQFSYLASDIIPRHPTLISQFIDTQPLIVRSQKLLLPLTPFPFPSPDKTQATQFLGYGKLCNTELPGEKCI